MNLVYLHGFNSSPQSLKAQQTKLWLADEHPEIDYICPFLSPYADRAVEMIESACKGLDWEQTLVMGSSMGGFYATWLAESRGCKAVLVNPAVRPWLGREYLLGEQTNFYTAKTYPFSQRDIDNFALFGVKQISSPENIWVLLQTGDEVLDYRHAREFYSGCPMTVEDGGDHSFQQFERFLPDILRFWKE